jgi:hypothetical protein
MKTKYACSINVTHCAKEDYKQEEKETCMSLIKRLDKRFEQYMVWRPHATNCNI